MCRKQLWERAESEREESERENGSPDSILNNYLIFQRFQLSRMHRNLSLPLSHHCRVLELHMLNLFS